MSIATFDICDFSVPESEWKMAEPLPCNFCKKLVDSLIIMLPVKAYVSPLMDICEDCNEEAILIGIARPN
jgi:hypothetical protein